MADLVKGPCLAASVNLPKCSWLGATISHSASSKIVKAGTASWRSYLNQCGPLPILGRIRASLQKINSYSCLPDDLYGMQPLNLTPHLLWKYFFTASYPESVECFQRKTDHLYRSEELRVCVSTSIREAMMGHAWNVMVSASPLRIKQTKFSASLTPVFVSVLANKLWRLLAEDEINRRVTGGEDTHVV